MFFTLFSPQMYPQNCNSVLKDTTPSLRFTKVWKRLCNICIIRIPSLVAWVFSFPANLFRRFCCKVPAKRIKQVKTFLEDYFGCAERKIFKIIANIGTYNPRGNKLLGMQLQHFGDLCGARALSGLIREMRWLQGMRFPFTLGPYTYYVSWGSRAFKYSHISTLLI